MPDLNTPAGRDELRRCAESFAADGCTRMSVSLSKLLSLLDQADATDKLQRFKDWVHGYLDAKGIPHHPPGTHGAEGCRIGDRMDYVFAKIDAGAALAQRVIRAARLLGIANSDTEPNAAETQMLVDDILTHCADLADVEWREWRAEDAEPVTEEWARLAGAVQTFESEPLELFWWIPMADKSDRTFVKVTFKLDGSTSMGIRGSTVALNPTRGHVRRLCAALGLTLPPPPARAAAEET